MKKLNLLTVALLASAAAAQRGVAQESPHRFTFSARAVFNASLKFKGDGSLPAIPLARTTPDGDPYNYDNGYIYEDISGNVGGLTWYWGYDDSASQVVGNTIEFNRTTAGTDLTGDSSDDGPAIGGELLYNYDLFQRDELKFGFEAGISFFELSLNETISGFGTVRRVTDAYPITPGTTPPQAPPIYQGSFTGPGFTIGDTPVTSGTSILPNGASVTSQRDVESSIWGGRLGPSLNLPATDRLHFTFSLGAAIAVVDSSATWSQSVTIPGVGTGARSGSSEDVDFLVGPYVAGLVHYEFAEHWGVSAGVQYSHLGEARDSFAGGSVEVDLSHIVAATVGLSYSF